MSPHHPCGRLKLAFALWNSEGYAISCLHWAQVGNEGWNPCLQGLTRAFLPLKQEEGVLERNSRRPGAQVSPVRALALSLI